MESKLVIYIENSHRSMNAADQASAVAGAELKLKASIRATDKCVYDGRNGWALTFVEVNAEKINCILSRVHGLCRELELSLAKDFQHLDGSYKQ